MPETIVHDRDIVNIRDLDCQYKTAFVLAHKLREAVAAQAADKNVAGEVEIDGAYFGGHVRPANHVDNRVDRRKAQHQTGKRKVVVTMRERNGSTLTATFKSEGEALPIIDAGSTVHADEATHWDALHSLYLTKRINHSQSYSDGEACTNQAEKPLAARGTRHSSPHRRAILERLRR